MSVSKEEMLEIIDGVCATCMDGKRCPNEYCRVVFKAIHDLIEKVGEWQDYIRQAILVDIYKATGHIIVTKLLEEIRDYGKE